MIHLKREVSFNSREFAFFEDNYIVGGKVKIQTIKIFKKFFWESIKTGIFKKIFNLKKPLRTLFFLIILLNFKY